MWNLKVADDGPNAYPMEIRHPEVVGVPTECRGVQLNTHRYLPSPENNKIFFIVFVFKTARYLQFHTRLLLFARIAYN